MASSVGQNSTSHLSVQLYDSSTNNQVQLSRQLRQLTDPPLLSINRAGVLQHIDIVSFLNHDFKCLITNQ